MNKFQDLIKYCEIKWKLTILDPFELSYNFVAPAIRDNGQEVVVKLSIPTNAFFSEVEALQYFAGKDMVSIIDMDINKGIIILDRLLPGHMLASIEDDELATKIAATIMDTLWVKETQSTKLPQIEEREKSLLRFLNNYPEGKGPITTPMLHKATNTFRRLLADGKDRYILHGDLHHYNILKGEKWTAIDPKGLVGEREYDTIQFLLNKLPESDLEPVLKVRIEILVNRLELDEKRLLEWGFVHSVLSTCWSLEESNDYNIAFYKSIFVFEKLHKDKFGRLEC
ncbi:aminoglycoside phosphotransferase family protein [Sutcliffiella rhizosphaerae]|uniref:aminoglycoside phosphotransferase family protein n=1 Tax=Sutcliffiella rhizosphaerae TaxID=2880967 RepID=UPI001E529BA0|nr:aminoglycoside phosphotransferase family protein [Sutcliffiella rhizosphaerae]